MYIVAASKWQIFIGGFFKKLTEMIDFWNRIESVLFY